MQDEEIEDEDLGEGVMGIYDVEKILDKKKVNGVWKYLIKWEGWENPEDLTWEPLEHLESVPLLLSKFEEEYTKKQQKKQDLINEQIKKTREKKEKEKEQRRNKYINTTEKQDEKENSFELDECDKDLTKEELEEKYTPGIKIKVIIV